MSKYRETALRNLQAIAQSMAQTHLMLIDEIKRQVKGAEELSPFEALKAELGVPAEATQAPLKLVEEDPGQLEDSEKKWEPKAGDWVRITRPENPSSGPGWEHLGQMDYLDGAVVHLVESDGSPWTLGVKDPRAPWGRWLIDPAWCSPAEPPAPIQTTADVLKIELTPPGAPEEPETIEKQELTQEQMDSTIWVKDGKAYRLATQEDVGKKVRVSDAFISPIECGPPETLLEVCMEGYGGHRYNRFRRSLWFKYAWVEMEVPEVKAEDPAPEIPTDAGPPGPEPSKQDLLDARIMEADGHRWRLAQPGDIGRKAFFTDIDDRGPCITDLQKLCDVCQGVDKHRFQSPGVWWRYAWIPFEMIESPLALPAPAAAEPEPEWITPGPEHVGQMVEVRDSEDPLSDESEWKPRMLIAILARKKAELQGRFVCKCKVDSHHHCFQWKHARVKKGS